MRGATVTEARTVTPPLGGAAFAADSRLLERVRAVGERTGVDYTDDAAVSDLLGRHRVAVGRATHGPAGWIGGLALAAGVIWPFVGHTAPATAGRPLLAYAPAGPLLVLAAACLTLARLRWKRALMHKELAGYREALGLARAYGIEPAHVPPWLEGRREDGGGKGAAPIPRYAPVEQADEGTGTPPSSTLPPKPAAVSEYERVADQGGWHDEVGWLLLFAGGIGPAVAVSSGEPLGLAALALVPLAVVVWVAGHRQGSRKAGLRPEAEAYARAVVAARAAGVETPDLSPQLHALLDD
ncbi:hypothetical protein DD630_19665 [Streptomyces sp. BSE7F]|nr:hypothetical protein [Streptomyces sp. BSE7-9]PWE08822.1 hypothetical protein DD630_19665 [Streptomyces sp. BSE7F]